MNLPKPSERRLRPANLPFVLAEGTLAVLLIAVVASIVGRHWYATSDWAIEVLRIREVGTSHTPLVGAYSRLGFAHPGPLPFWLLAGPQRLFGDTGILVGTAVLNVASLGLALWVARRHGGNRLLILLWLAEIGLIHGLGVSFLADPWNPYLPVLPFLAFLLLLWGVALGDPPLIPLAVLTGSYALQSHVGYAPLVIGLTGLTAAACLARRWQARSGAESAAGGDGQGDEADTEPTVARPSGGRGDRRSDHRGRGRGRSAAWAWGSLLLGLALWAAPLLQQLYGRSGNLAAILDEVRHPVGQAVGLSNALGVLGTEVGPPPAWFTGHDSTVANYTATSRVWPAVLLLLASVVLVGLAVARRAWRPAALLAGTTIATAIGVFAVSRVTGVMAPYLIRWWWPLLALAAAAFLWCAMELFAPSALAVRRLAVRAGVVVATAATAVILVAGVPVELPTSTFSVAVGHLGGPTARALDPGARYFLSSIDAVSLGATGVGMLTELEGRGFKVYVDEIFVDAVDGRRVLEPQKADATVLVVAGEDEAAGWRPPAGARVVASFDPLPAADRHEERRIQDRFRRLLGNDAPAGPIVFAYGITPGGMAQRGASARDIERLGQIQAAGDSYRVYLVEPPPA